MTVADPLPNHLLTCYQAFKVMKKRILTGITPTGAPHLGNYVGAIRPAIMASQMKDVDAFYFIADYHALIKCKNPQIIQRASLEVAATWLAAGLDYEKVTFYRQSDLSEILELNWILTTCCTKGLMNRAHAYKAAVQENLEQSLTDEDHRIEMGLYCYPILMAADILLLNANLVPVGKDQLQHIEMTRDIANRFNHRYQPLFSLPEALVDDQTPLLLGIDGQKMSKSYGNTIALFDPPNKLRKRVMKILTNSLEPGQAKSTIDSTVYNLYSVFASEAEQETMRQAFAKGIAWGEAKQQLFEKLDNKLEPMRERYNQLISHPMKIEEILQYGAEKARALVQPFLCEIKHAVGIKSLG